MKLDEFRVDKGLTFAGLADLIGFGVTPKMAERYCKGVRPRRAEIMLKIVEISENRVTPNDWYDLGPSKIARRSFSKKSRPPKNSLVGP